MTVVVPSTDVGNYNLQAIVTQLTANLSAAQTAGNWPLAQQLTQQLDQAQQNLVNSLMASGNNRAPGAGNTGGPKPSFLTASNILATRTINT